MSKSVLLVDNENTSRRSVQSALERLGYEVTALNNSSLALPMLLLRQVEQRPFNLLMLGSDFPDAEAIAAKAADSPLFGGVSVIMLCPEGTAPGSNGRRVVTKPVDPVRLQAEVAACN